MSEVMNVGMMNVGQSVSSHFCPFTTANLVLGNFNTNLSNSKISSNSETATMSRVDFASKKEWSLPPRQLASHKALWGATNFCHWLPLNKTATTIKESIFGCFFKATGQMFFWLI